MFVLLARRRPAWLAFAMLAAISGLAALGHSPSAAAGAAEGRRDTYVFMSAGARNTVVMNGSTEDIGRARSLRTGEEGLLYVRQSGVAYVIRDEATLREATAIFRPQQEMGNRQAELGSRQAALGHRQAGIGAEQARVGGQHAGASSARARTLGARQEALGRRQDALGRQQEALGREQAALGRDQERLSRVADARMRALLADAIRRGTARRID
jgi:hypothetical protein